MSKDWILTNTNTLPTPSTSAATGSKAAGGSPGHAPGGSVHARTGRTLRSSLIQHTNSSESADSSLLVNVRIPSPDLSVTVSVVDSKRRRGEASVGSASITSASRDASSHRDGGDGGSIGGAFPGSGSVSSAMVMASISSDRLTKVSSTINFSGL